MMKTKTPTPASPTTHEGGLASVVRECAPPPGSPFHAWLSFMLDLAESIDRLTPRELAVIIAATAEVLDTPMALVLRTFALVRRAPPSRALVLKRRGKKVA